MATRAWDPGRTRQGPDINLIVGAPLRGAPRLDTIEIPPNEWVPSLDSAWLAALPADCGGYLITGGETTLRSDLPDLIAALTEAGAPRVGIATDGFALASAETVKTLRNAGLRRVRVPFHCAHPEAHDWLVGTTGAARRVVRALRSCGEQGLDVEAEIVVTRPTAPYLVETVEILARLAVSRVRIRRIVGRGPALDQFVALSPRLGLLEPLLASAVGAGRQSGIDVSLHGFPRCSVGAVGDCLVGVSAETWVSPRSGDMSERVGPPSSAGGCSRCPGAPTCGGAPSDYVRRFGWGELRSEEPGPAEVSPQDRSAAASAGPEPPPPRAGRAPATRLHFITRQARLGSLGGDPLIGIRAKRPSTLRIAFYAPSRVGCSTCGDHGCSEPESTRAARVRLARAAQEGCEVLRVASAGSLAHPHGAELLREATRLAIPKVELATEGSSLAELSDSQLVRLRRLSRADIALYGPDGASHDAHTQHPGSFDAALDALTRWARLTPVKIGAFAVLHDETHLPAFSAAWERRDLPGDPAFRLSPRGGSLDSLADAARALPEGPSRDALAAVIPACLLARRADISPQPPGDFAWGDEPIALREPSGSDRFGVFRPCAMAPACSSSARCPGIAVGWSSQRIGPSPAAPGDVT